MSRARRPPPAASRHSRLVLHVATHQVVAERASRQLASRESPVNLLMQTPCISVGLLLPRTIVGHLAPPPKMSDSTNELLGGAAPDGDDDETKRAADAMFDAASVDQLCARTAVYTSVRRPRPTRWRAGANKPPKPDPACPVRSACLARPQSERRVSTMTCRARSQHGQAHDDTTNRRAVGGAQRAQYGHSSATALFPCRKLRQQL